MTGRKGRVVSNDDGSITYESRSELDVPVEILNLTEKQRFMDGEKVIGGFYWELISHFLFFFCRQQTTDFSNRTSPSSRKPPARAFPCKLTAE